MVACKVLDLAGEANAPSQFLSVPELLEASACPRDQFPGLCEAPLESPQPRKAGIPANARATRFGAVNLCLN